MRPFHLERQYRDAFRRGMLDISSSSPLPLSARTVLEAAGSNVTALLDAPLEYEPGGGSDDLRTAVAALDPQLDPADILITSGASEAIRVVLTALVAAGDEVVVQAGSYQALRETPRSLGATIHDWLPSNGMQFAFNGLPAGHDDARAIIYNNPYGPSGSLVRGAYLGPARLVADEVYRPVSLVPGTSTQSVVGGYANAVSIGDLSKPLGLGGLRIGWIATRDRNLLAACAGILDYCSGSVSALSARVGLAALARFEHHLGAHLARARENLSSLAAFVEEHEARVDWVPPQAGYTAFLRLRGGAPGAAFFNALACRGVFALDGAAFGKPDHLRIGVGLATDEFARGLSVVGDVLRSVAAPASSPAPQGDVILIAKEPVAGFAKTRLAATVGQDRATRLAQAFLADTIACTTPRARHLHVGCAPEGSLGVFRQLAPRARCFAQTEGDLGARLTHAFETAFEDGATRPVLIGSDSPTLAAHLIAVAHEALTTHDVVLGPTTDGGYYLVGMSRPHPEIFHDIDWSSERVLAQTIGRAHAAHISVFFLPYWYDVDDEAGLDRLARDPHVGANTQRALALPALVEVAS